MSKLGRRAFFGTLGKAVAAAALATHLTLGELVPVLEEPMVVEVEVNYWSMYMGGTFLGRVKNLKIDENGLLVPTEEQLKANKDAVFSVCYGKDKER